MNNPKEIGEILKNARKKKNLTIEKAYRATRIQPNIIEALETGKADALLGRVYVILFLKKYAVFLDLDSDGLAVAYKTSYPEEEKQVLSIDAKNEPFAISDDVRKWIAVVGAVSLALLFLFFTLFVARSLKAFYHAGRKTAKPKTVLVAAAEKVFPIPENKSINLNLRATDDVWMRVKEKKKVLFEGTLRKNETKSFSSEDSISLWLGRAEALDFTINGKAIGKIGQGRIKNALISRNGLKVEK